MFETFALMYILIIILALVAAAAATHGWGRSWVKVPAEVACVGFVLMWYFTLISGHVPSTQEVPAPVHAVALLLVMLCAYLRWRIRATPA